MVMGKERMVTQANVDGAMRRGWDKQIVVGQGEDGGAGRLWCGRKRMMKAFFSFSFQVGREI